MKAAKPSDNDGTGGGGNFSSRPLLKSLMKPLFLCFRPFPSLGEFTTNAGSEPRRSGFGGVFPTMLVSACFALAPALIDRARALKVTPWIGGLCSPGPSVLGKFVAERALGFTVVLLRVLWARASSSDMRLKEGEAARSGQPARFPIRGGIRSLSPGRTLLRIETGEEISLPNACIRGMCGSDSKFGCFTEAFDSVSVEAVSLRGIAENMGTLGIGRG